MSNSAAQNLIDEFQKALLLLLSHNEEFEISKYIFTLTVSSLEDDSGAFFESGTIVEPMKMATFIEEEGWLEIPEGFRSRFGTLPTTVHVCLVVDLEKHLVVHGLTGMFCRALFRPKPLSIDDVLMEVWTIDEPPA